MLNGAIFRVFLVRDKAPNGNLANMNDIFRSVGVAGQVIDTVSQNRDNLKRFKIYKDMTHNIVCLGTTSAGTSVTACGPQAMQTWVFKPKNCVMQYNNASGDLSYILTNQWYFCAIGSEGGCCYTQLNFVADYVDA